MCQSSRCSAMFSAIIRLRAGFQTRHQAGRRVRRRLGLAFTLGAGRASRESAARGRGRSRDRARRFAGRILVGDLAVQFVPVLADRNEEHVHARTTTVAQLSGVDRTVAIIRACSIAACFLAAAALAAASTAAARQAAPPGAAIRTEFRVFDGASEVTGDTRLRVRPSGSSETGQSSKAATSRSICRPASTTCRPSGRRADRSWASAGPSSSSIMPYPDEGGRHLEVINFTNQFGALQLSGRTGRRRIRRA